MPINKQFSKILFRKMFLIYFFLGERAKCESQEKY